MQGAILCRPTRMWEVWKMHGAIFNPYFLYMPYVELHISNDWSSAHRHECDNQILMLILQDQLDNAGSFLRHRSTVHDYYRAG